MFGYGSMTVVLKNNKNLLSKRDKFKKTHGGYSKEKTEFNLPKASPQLLRKIRNKMIKDHQSRQRKILVVWLFFMICALSFVASQLL